MGDGLEHVWIGGGKNQWLVHLRSSHDASRHSHNGQRFCGSNLRSPPPNWCPPLVPLFSRDFGGSAKYPSEKQASQHLTLYTLGMDSH